MKLIVKNIFRDKNDHVTIYRAGTVLDWNDAERCAEVISRGLCEELEASEEPEVSKESEAVEEEPEVSEAPEVSKESEAVEEEPEVSKEPEVSEGSAELSDVDAPQEAAATKSGGGRRVSKK